MDFLSNLFSSILGGFGGGATGAGGGGFTNPFSGVMGGASQLIGGPASQQGTLFSLPGELGHGIENLITSENILGDTLGLAKPILGLGSKALDIINPFKYLGFGAEGGGGLANLPPPLSQLALAAPFLAAGAYGGWSDRQKRKRGEPVGIIS